MRGRFGFLLLLSALAPRTLHADPGREARAEGLFREGEALFDKKEVDRACEKFSESFRLDPKLGTLLNVAYCHESQGKTATAWSAYNEAAALAVQKGQKDRELFALEHARELARRLSRVEFALPDGELTGVYVDGSLLPSHRFRAPMFLDPGEHTVRVTAVHKHPRTVGFRVMDGPAAQGIVVPPLEDYVETKKTITPSRNEEQEEEERHNRRTLAWVFGGTGALGLLLGTYFGVHALSTKEDAGGLCAGNQCSREGARLYDNAHRAATLSTIGFGVGLAGLGVGTVLYISSNPKKRELHRASVGARGTAMGLFWEGSF